MTICLARRLLLFYEQCTYESGSSREGLFRAPPAHSPDPGVPVSAGIRKGVRNSWRYGTAAGSGFLAAGSPAPAPGAPAAGAATRWPRDAACRLTAGAGRAGETALKMRQACIL